MRKLITLLLALAMLVFLPSTAWGDDTQSVSVRCQEISQAQSSEEMVRVVDSAFEALKAEAKADDVRIKETTPEVIEFGDNDGNIEEGLTLYVCTVERNGRTMRYLIFVKGKPDESGYPLYITLHGGGQVAPELNDSQWYDMSDYYRSSVDHGIYVACRGMEDSWDMHSLPDSYAMYDRIIEDMVLLKDADPNRVYLLGFSAGGDGVFQVTPRMADRFAAVNMSSGHPNDVSLLNVANVPFEIQVGVVDFYSPTALRCIKSAEYEKKLSQHHDTFGFGYEHRVLVHVPDGHNFNDNSEDKNPNSVVLTDPATYASRALGEDWIKTFVKLFTEYYPISGPADEEAFRTQVSRLSYHANGDLLSSDINPNLEDAKREYAEFCTALTKQVTGNGDGEFAMETETIDTDAVHYVNRFTRNYCPSQMVWDLTTRASQRTVSSFYWLKADKALDKGQITASFDVDANAFTLNPSDDVAGDFSILINPRMVDVSRPVTFVTPKGSFTVKITADPKTLEASLREVTDPFLAWVQEVSYQQLGCNEKQEPQPDDPGVIAHAYSGNGGGVWTMGSNDPLQFSFERVGDGSKTFPHFVGVRLDGSDMPIETYETSLDVSDGHLLVSLKPNYLKTLTTGDHQLTAVFDDGEATVSFSVTAPNESRSTKPDVNHDTVSKLPKTGDANPMGPLVCAASGLAAVAAALCLRQKQRDY